MSTTIRSKAAIGLGVLFSTIASWILLWDVRSLGDLTTDHVQALAALAGTICAGHFAITAMRQGLVVWGLMLGMAFGAGTFVCIMGSAGRGAETMERRTADAGRVNDVRRDALAELAKARAKRDELADQFARECGSGRQGRCNGLKFALDSADSHAAILQVRADNAAPEQTANPKIRHAARFLSFFWQFDQKRAEEGLELLWPVALPLINEALAIAFFGLGFGHRRVASTVATVPPRLPPPSAVPCAVQTPVTIDGEWTPMSVERARELARKLECERTLDALLRANRPLSNDELAAAMSVSKAESSRRVSSLVQLGLACRQPSGRYVQISLRPMAMN